MKIRMLKGLPGSGKSTKAKEIVTSGGNFMRVNRDHLREMLFFSDFKPKMEKYVIEIEQLIASYLISEGINVVVDDCNLGAKNDKVWEDTVVTLKQHGLNPSLEIESIDTSIEECLARDSQRKGRSRVGPEVIWGMALHHMIYQPKSVVLCDIDGTLADIQHKLHFVKRPAGEKKDWKSFFEGIPEDSVREEVVKILYEQIADGSDLFIVTGRPDTYREITQVWLEQKAFAGRPLPFKAMFMRPGYSKEEDVEIKRKMLRRYFPDKSVIKCVIDDRPAVVEMWKEEGLTVIDVGNGIPF